MSSENNLTVIGFDEANIESVSESISLLSNGEAKLTTVSSQRSTTRPLTHYERLKRFCDENGISYKEGTYPFSNGDGPCFNEKDRPDLLVPTKWIDLSEYALGYGLAVVHFRQSDETFFGIEPE